MHVQDPTETNRLPLSQESQQKSQPMNPQQMQMGQFPFFHLAEAGGTIGLQDYACLSTYSR